MKLATLRFVSAILVTFAIVIGVSGNADAQRRRRADSSTTPFEANKTFGLGIMIGAPTGLSAKYYLSEKTALDFGLGVQHRWRYHDAISFHMDFLWHPAVLAETEPFILPIYFGVGGRVLDHDHHRDFHDDDGTHFGVRVPIGIMMDFNTVPIDIFFELALVLDFITEDGHDDHADFNGAIGARYYF